MISSYENADTAQVALPLMENIQSIWQYLHHRVENQDIDELQMRMCVLTLRDYLKHFSSVKALNFVEEQIQTLDHFLPLKTSQTGRHMEGLWEVLKPLTPPTRLSFEELITLEKLADNFDELQWDSLVPPSQLVQVRQSFAGAMQLVREGHPETDSQALIHGLEEVLAGMIKPEQDLNLTIRPFFRSEFDQICKQFYLYLASDDVDLEQLGSLYQYAAVFAETPTKSPVMASSSKTNNAKQSRMLQYLSGYIGDSELLDNSLELKISLDRSIVDKL
jgi:hypothetical protein